jgi:hypothetical protein
MKSAASGGECLLAVFVSGFNQFLTLSQPLANHLLALS